MSTKKVKKLTTINSFLVFPLRSLCLHFSTKISCFVMSLPSLMYWIEKKKIT